LNFSSNLQQIQERIRKTCIRANRDCRKINLIAVTKGFNSQVINDLAEQGIGNFGELTVREAYQKIGKCSSSLKWHFLGKLKPKQAAEAVKIFNIIHYVHSAQIADIINQAAKNAGKNINICLKMNFSDSMDKFGLNEDQALKLINNSVNFLNVTITGLSAVVPVAKEPEQERGFFTQLNQIRDRLQQKTGVELPDLSMGKSHDFEIAIEEGATWIRIGKGLFEKGVY
jgi:PLP dependent protein